MKRNYIYSKILSVHVRDFRIFFLKVGNGHCSYIEFPYGQNAIIDLYVSQDPKDDNVIQILKSANISHINYLLITHPHRDHIGGLSEFVKNFSIGEFIYSPLSFRPDPIYEDWAVYSKLTQGNPCNCASRVKKGWSSTIGDCQLLYLAPDDRLLNAHPESVNSNGLVVKIVARGHNIIIPGDIESDGWQYINNEDIKNTTLLLAPHHGNNSGYDLEKVRAMSPAFIVISTGPKTEHDADQKYRYHARKGVFTTRTSRIVATVDSANVMSIK